jgi:hypothetical protein
MEGGMILQPPQGRTVSTITLTPREPAATFLTLPSRSPGWGVASPVRDGGALRRAPQAVSGLTQDTCRPLRSDAPQVLESDLRTQHLSLEVTRTSENAYGVVYEIDGPISTPSGQSMRFRSIWQVDTGTDLPRFITMYPR